MTNLMLMSVWSGSQRSLARVSTFVKPLFRLWSNLRLASEYAPAAASPFISVSPTAESVVTLCHDRNR